MPKVGLILSGCGVHDGSDIHETIITLYHLQRAGVEVRAFAPDIEQTEVINHVDGKALSDRKHRNVLEESARLMRGKILPIADAYADNLDALIVPGGLGAANNISDFSYRDNIDDVAVELHIDGLIKSMYDFGKPMGFMCISGASVASVALRGKGINVTIGNDNDTIKRIQMLGNSHVECDVNNIVVDDKNNIVSTPAYMLGENIIDIESGISKLVAEIISRIPASEPADDVDAPTTEIEE